MNIEHSGATAACTGGLVEPRLPSWSYDIRLAAASHRQRAQPHLHRCLLDLYILDTKAATMSGQ